MLDKDGQATKNFHVLKSYAQYIEENDRVVVKVPQIISAQKLRRGNQYIENEAYLDAKIFTKQFYEPAIDLLGPSLGGMIFEQEYQKNRTGYRQNKWQKSSAGFLNPFQMTTAIMLN